MEATEVVPEIGEAHRPSNLKGARPNLSARILGVRFRGGLALWPFAKGFHSALTLAGDFLTDVAHPGVALGPESNRH
ncbi:MAG: hypothetical protein ABW034_06970 [Steroidobacteraceae bacterium]